MILHHHHLPGTNQAITAGYENGAYCHQGGHCVCSDPQIFHGLGCTREGKAKHAGVDGGAPPLPGDLPSLHCDARGLFAGQTLGDVTGSVLRSSPDVLVLDAVPSFPRTLALGDEIYVQGQRRRVLSIGTEGKLIRVGYPFRLTLRSSYEFVIRPKTSVHRVGAPERTGDYQGRHGNIARCISTDVRPLSDETLFCESNADRPNCGRATVSGTGDFLYRIVKFGGRTTDPNDYDSDSITNERVPGALSDVEELRIGDRLRIGTCCWTVVCIFFYFFLFFFLKSVLAGV